MTQLELETIFKQSELERQERLDALNEYESTEAEYERKILDIMKIHEYNVISLKHFGAIDNLDLSILGFKVKKSCDLNNLTIIELQSILHNLTYDIRALEMDDIHEDEYYNLTVNQAFELLEIANEN
jgi:hypothetical protein